jgi:hypothetical protein
MLVLGQTKLQLLLLGHVKPYMANTANGMANNKNLP